LALAYPYTTKMVAEKFVEGVVKLYGMPRSIISDRDPIFISHFCVTSLKCQAQNCR
jgi:hypothetical protein